MVLNSQNISEGFFQFSAFRFVLFGCYFCFSDLFMRVGFLLHRASTDDDRTKVGIRCAVGAWGCLVSFNAVVVVGCGAAATAEEPSNDV